MFRIGGNTFYDQNNKLLMKILEFKRSGIGLIAEFRGIPNGFPNQDHACNHPSSCRTCCSSCPCCCIDHDHGVDHLDDDNEVGDRCNHIGCFNGSWDICGNGAACSLIHCYVLEEHEPYSFLLAASCPW